MSNIVTTTVHLGGESLPYYRSIVLEEYIFGHSRFTAVLPSEYIDGREGYLFEKSRSLVGKDFILQSGILGISEPQLQFAGIVTHIGRSRSNGYSGDLEISGYSPTVLLDSGPHCRSWENATLREIFTDVLQYFPANKLNAKVSPQYGTSLDYVVQYQETAWEFLCRMCATYGEWLYYDGASLVVGSPDGGSGSLSFGSDLDRFDLSVDLKPVNRKVMAYDYGSTAVYSGRPGSVAQKAGLDLLGSYAWDASRSLYATSPKAWDNSSRTAEGQLQDAVDMRSAMTGGSLVQFEGRGSNPCVKPGTTVSVGGRNVYTSAAEDYGSYTVTGSSHELLPNSSYTNTFTAVPSSVKVPPVGAVPNPRCETQSAKVVENNDPRGLGRVRVRFHWMGGGETTPWIRVTTPHAGGGKGMYFIPEVGEEVIVGFEGDSATKPYVIGAVYNSLGNNSYSNAGNDVKALQSRSGNKLVLNDNAGSVYLSDQGQANLLFDGVGNIVSNNSADYESYIGANQTTKVTVTQTNNVGTQHQTNVGNGQSILTMDNAGNVSIAANTSITLSVGSHKLSIDNAGTVTLNGVKLNTSMQNQINMSAPNNHIAGITKIDGGDTFIN